MGVIEDEYEELDTDISLAEFREAVETRIEEMGGLADEETAAMLVAHELGEAGGEIDQIADIEAGMEEVKFLGKVLSVDELRTFERDDEEEPGHVLNTTVADESSEVTVTFWDARARDAAEKLESGDVLRVKGRPAEGYTGLEVNVTDAEPAPDVEIDVRVDDTYRIEDLRLGQSNVNLIGRVLSTEPVRTFDRDDGSEGQVANLVVGDETGRVRVTLWDGTAEEVTALANGETVELIDAYTRERDGDLEVHLGESSRIENTTEEVSFDPDPTAIETVAEGDTVDLRGVVRSVDPKRTFERDDGSDGQVKNIELQDETDAIRVALWGDHADVDLGPGDAVALLDVTIDDGWQDALEAAANWESAVVPLDASPVQPAPEQQPTEGGGIDLSAFEESDTSEDDEPAEPFTATGEVIQTGDPTILDTGNTTVKLNTATSVSVGELITVHGEKQGEYVTVEELSREVSADR